MPTRVVALTLVVYLALAGGHAYSGDSVIMVRVTESIATRGAIDVRPIEHFEDYAVAPGRHGRVYAKYGLALSVSALPLYALFAAIEPWVPDEALAAFDGPKILYYDRTDKPDVIRTFGAVFTNAFVSAATAGLLAAILVGLGLSPHAAALGALVWAFTGVTPYYAKTFFSEPLAGLLLLLAVWAIRRAHVQPSRLYGSVALASLLLGLSILTRVAHVVLALPGLLALAVLLRAHPGLSVARTLGAAALGFVGPVAALLAYNALRFGNPFETGYGDEAGAFSGNPAVGMAGLLVSPGRGLLWYFPWAVLSMAGLRALHRSDAAVAVLTGGSAATLLALYSSWHMWEGGWCYGPRFLVPVLPLLAVPAALAANDAWPRWRGAVVGLAALSGSLALQSVRINDVDYTYVLYRTLPDWQEAVRWSWEASPLIGYWHFPLTDALIWPRLLAFEGGALLAAFAWLILLLIPATLWWLASPLRRSS